MKQNENSPEADAPAERIVQLAGGGTAAPGKAGDGRKAARPAKRVHAAVAALTAADVLPALHTAGDAGAEHPLFAFLSAADAPGRVAFEAALLAFLAEHTERHTMGDSTSVRVEIAQELLAGVLYCIDIQMRKIPGMTPSAAEVPALFQTGVCEVFRLVRRGRLLLHQAEAAPPPVTNVGYIGTLSSIPNFFRLYDPEYFPLRIPCDIDYPLCFPLPDTLHGVEYVNAYLRQILTENAFLRLFERERLLRVYTSAFGGDAGLLVNLYAPVAETAVGCALAGRPVPTLRLAEGDREAILADLSQCADDEAERRLTDAADRALSELSITSPSGQACLRRLALTLLPRIRACAGSEAATGLFS